MAKNRSDQEISVRLDKESVFSILAIGVRIEADSRDIYEETNIDENAEEINVLIWQLMRIFTHILDDAEIEKEFIQYVKENFNIEIEDDPFSAPPSLNS